MSNRSRVVKLQCDWSDRIGPGVGHGRNSQGVRVDSRLRSIIVDICSEGGLLSIFVASASLLATTTSAASLSLGRSVSARTAVGPALLLLLLLGKLGVSRLALHSAKLVGLWALTTAAMSCTKQVWYSEHGR